MNGIAKAPHPLMGGNPPTWARGWGQDRYGVFVDLRIETIKQRMRWIPPGKFLMGSPESEVGRFEQEGPRHEVELIEGFWLADTPCTQELWQAVMGGSENPSYFRSPRRPVEQVSWDDCQKFLHAFNSRQPGLDLRLPTEAQWERACRAETDGATWLGDFEVLGTNAPILDGIAWYGGNSGHEFDLDDGEDSSHWKEKQHPHDRAGTREVKLKNPNPWGLYDMLGNVWEWSSDFWADRYLEGPRSDPAGPAGGAGRVLRGGSWGADARRVRAACRLWFRPVGRDRSLGFRLSRGP